MTATISETRITVRVDEHTTITGSPAIVTAWLRDKREADGNAPEQPETGHFAERNF
jgi:hypothetical protein